MCRRNVLLGYMLAAFGVGMLIGCFFESGFFCIFLGLAAVIGGVVVVKKK